MKQYTIKEFNKFFEIFNNLQPTLNLIVEEHNECISELKRLYGDKPYLEESDFEYIPVSDCFDIDKEEQCFSFSEEIYLGCGDYEMNYGNIPFSWLTNHNWKEELIESETKYFKDLEEKFLLKEKEKEIARVKKEQEKLEKEKQQYELLKAKFEGEL